MEKNSVLSICCAPNVQYITLEIVKQQQQQQRNDENHATHNSQFIRGSNRSSRDCSQSCGGCCHGDSGDVVSHTAIGGIGEGTVRARQAVSAEADP